MRTACETEGLTVSKRYEQEMIEQIQQTDTPLPGKGWQEVATVIAGPIVACVLYGIYKSMHASTNDAAWEMLRDYTANGFLWSAIAFTGWMVHALEIDNAIADRLADLFYMVRPSTTEFELAPMPDMEEQEQPEPLVRGIKWHDIDIYVAKVLLWKEHEERQGKTSWRQELAREWGLGKYHKALTQMLEDVGALVDYGPQQKGRLVILNRGEIMRRISVLK